MKVSILIIDSKISFSCVSISTFNKTNWKQKLIILFAQIENENARLRDKLTSLSKEGGFFSDCQENVKEKLKRADEIQNQFEQVNKNFFDKIKKIILKFNTNLVFFKYVIL